MVGFIGPALGVGGQAAQNPGIDFSQFASQLSLMDPLGNFITKLGGDPLNLYGNKNNPNALLFPSQNPNANGSAVPKTLPTLGIHPQMPQGQFGGLANLGPGPFNAMAAQSAGPQYMPQMPQTNVSPMQTPSPFITSGGKGMISPQALAASFPRAGGAGGGGLHRGYAF